MIRRSESRWSVVIRPISWEVGTIVSAGQRAIKPLLAAEESVSVRSGELKEAAERQTAYYTRFKEQPSGERETSKKLVRVEWYAAALFEGKQCPTLSGQLYF